MLSCRAFTCSTLLHRVKLFSKAVVPIHTATSLYESSLCLMSSSALAIVSLFLLGPSGGCKIVSYCDFRLHFL